nr:TetR/AcrR family transcriptional regulator [Bacteriovorax sp. HI3]
MAAKSTKPKNKDRLATEERLLSAAEQIIAKHGFKGATTRMIAKKADVNVALITRYFGGKYELLVRMVERKATEKRYTHLAYPVQESITDECLLFVRHRIKHFTEDLVIFRVILLQFLTDAKFLKRFQENLEIFERHPEFEERVLTLINDKKMINTIQPQQILDTLEDYIFGVVVGRILIHMGDDTMWEDVEHFVRSYCSSFELKK